MDEIISNTPKIPENIPQTAIEVPRTTENIVSPQTPPVVEDENKRFGLQEEIYAFSKEKVGIVDKNGYINVAQEEGKIPNPVTTSADDLLRGIS